MLRVAVHVAQAAASTLAVYWLAYTQLPDDHAGWELTLAILAIAWLGTEAVVRAGQSAWTKYRLDKLRPLQEEVHNELAEAFCTIIDIDVGPSDDHGDDRLYLDPADLGLSAFAVRWTRRGRRELVRITRLRLSATPRASPRIRWTRGKGLLGKCWEKGDIEYVEAEFWEPYKDYDKSRWNALDETTRMGLRFRDFRAIRGKYHEAFALPILGENSTVVGVVAIDLREVDGSTLPDQALFHDDIAQAVQQAADGVGKLMRVAG